MDLEAPRMHKEKFSKADHMSGQVLAVAMAEGGIYCGVLFAGVIILLLAASEWK